MCLLLDLCRKRQWQSCSGSQGDGCAVPCSESAPCRARMVSLRPSSLPAEAAAEGARSHRLLPRAPALLRWGCAVLARGTLEAGWAGLPQRLLGTWEALVCTQMLLHSWQCLALPGALAASLGTSGSPWPREGGRTEGTARVLGACCCCPCSAFCLGAPVSLGPALASSGFPSQLQVPFLLQEHDHAGLAKRTTSGVPRPAAPQPGRAMGCMHGVG